MNEELIVPAKLFRISVIIAITAALRHRKGTQYAQVPWDAIERLRETLAEMNVDWERAWHQARDE